MTVPALYCCVVVLLFVVVVVVVWATAGWYWSWILMMPCLELRYPMINRNVT
jgi:hypothetical protein